MHVCIICGAVFNFPMWKGEEASLFPHPLAYYSQLKSKNGPLLTDWQKAGDFREEESVLGGAHADACFVHLSSSQSAVRERQRQKDILILFQVGGPPSVISTPLKYPTWSRRQQFNDSDPSNFPVPATTETPYVQPDLIPSALVIFKI